MILQNMLGYQGTRLRLLLHSLNAVSCFFVQLVRTLLLVFGILTWLSMACSLAVPGMNLL